MKQQEQLLALINSIIDAKLKNKNMSGHWHLGKIDTPISRYATSVFVDGLSESYTVPCNPDVIFSSGDEVWVHYVNGDPNNKFIPYKRGTGTESYAL